MKRACEDAAVGDAKRTVPPEPSLPCTWQEMLRAWHARRETLLSALCTDVIDEITLLCGPCQTRQQIAHFDVPCVLLRSSQFSTRLEAFGRLGARQPVFPYRLWAAYGLVPQIVEDATRVIQDYQNHPTLLGPALHAIANLLEELRADRRYTRLLLASRVLPAVTTILSMYRHFLNADLSVRFEPCVDVYYLIDLLTELDVFLGDESPTQPSSSPCAEWWAFVRRVLARGEGTFLERWSCLYVVACRPHRHDLLTDEQWFAVVRQPGAPLSGDLFTLFGSLWFSGTGNLLRHRPALRALFVPPHVDRPPCFLDPKDTDFTRLAALEYADGCAHLPGVAQTVLDDHQATEQILLSVENTALRQPALSMLRTLTKRADTTSFVQSDLFPLFLKRVCAHAAAEPAIVCTILHFLMCDAPAAVAAELLSAGCEPLLRPLWRDGRRCIIQDVSRLYSEMQTVRFKQLQELLEPVVQAYVSLSPACEQELTYAVTTPRQSLGHAQFALRTLADWMDDKVTATEQVSPNKKAT